MEFSYFKSKKRNAFIVLSIFVVIISLYYSSIWRILALSLKYLPGFHINEDTIRNTEQIIKSRGFISESHYIKTSDGYILTVNRIVNPFVKNRKSLEPILLQHGFQNSANAWIINSNGKLSDSGQYLEDNNEGEVGNTLGFVLATKGFDVFLANMRGNVYSLNHTKHQIEDSEFWKFSIDEMIEYDLPAIISYIKKETSKESIAYIGHSQGTYMMFGLLATKPEYSQIIKPFIALSPVPFMGNATSPLIRGKPFISLMRSYPNPFLHLGKFQQFYSQLCDNYYFQNFCYKVLHFFLGFDRKQFDFSRTGVYVANLPSGSSSRNAAHLLQNVIRNSPSKFDFGEEENRLRYNSNEPPIYDLSAINSTNIALIYTANDWLNNVKDVQLLKKHLKVHLLDDYLVPDLSWNHMELLWAKETGKLVNSRILQLLQSFKLSQFKTINN